MSIFSVLADGQSGLFRLQQAKKPWEKELEAKDAQGQLAQMAAQAQGLLQPSAEWRSAQATAQAALEQARTVSGPKAAAAARLEQVERRIEELKLAMRFARGDAQKLASLAREAALLAREAGRAAKEYGAGIKAAAELGLPGDMAAAGGAVGSGTTSVSISRSSLTLQQTEVTLTIGISTGEGASAENAGDLAAATASAAADALIGGGMEPDALPAGEGSGAGRGSDLAGALPDDVARLVESVLSELGSGGLTGAGVAAGGPPGAGRVDPADRQAAIRGMMADNALKMSRYREADAFGRRVEGVLATSRRIIGEAKAANMAETSEEKRRERRDGFKADDKMVDAAQREVDRLRAAAFGSVGEGEVPAGGSSSAIAPAASPALDLLT